jgi:FkbM family methyltransferase
VDVGANVGEYGGRLARVCPAVHAFEPVPWLAEDLSRKLPRNVSLHRVALSDHVGSAQIRIPFRGDVEEHMCATLEDSNDLGGKHVQSIECQVARLDDVVNEPVGFIKIDVECVLRRTSDHAQRT